LTLWASTPVGDLGFIDFVALVVRRLKAWSRADRAVHVYDASTVTTDQMMMIVVDSIFIASCGSFWLDTAKETVGHQNRERVVDGLARNSSDIQLGDVENFISGHVRAIRHCAKH
jgi:secreted PhoX family phosphatase